MYKSLEEIPAHRITPKKILHLKHDEIFIYGANEQGIQGAGAARDALKWGARYGFTGLSGQTYGICTKSTPYTTLPLFRIKEHVDKFFQLALTLPNRRWLLTPVGTGLAGYGANQIAPMFKPAIEIENVTLPIEFWKVLLNLR